ncbi:hypothetical protein HTV45_10250 [Streptomyces sp. CHD11]|uniref:hypothetical protein n=1 Tax=Streptomyces sp. CHD11 TaxID=2741325 RepID=UPI001BFC5A5C|nr:hypothetical protein [Streptomyces sp. CHD11]MBT3151259.1 hypothetical protein [Streptomyces sp. CHD11]
MADPAAVMASLAEFLDNAKGRYTLEYALPERRNAAKRPYRFDVEILLPLVEGTMCLEWGPRSVEGRVVLLERPRKTQRDEGRRTGEFVFTVQGSSEVSLDIEVSFTNGWGDVMTSVLEFVSPHESDDLRRHLARLLVRADEQVESAGALCDRLAEAEEPAGLLAHSEALWAHARLLLLIGRDEAAAGRAAEGAAQAARSGLPAGERMARSGEVLASALRWSGRTDAAERVGRILPVRPPAEGEPGRRDPA